MSSQRRGRGSSAGSVAPLYARLPHGPHRLDHKQVIRHQRARIHGAMVEAVAANGYAGTSVREVVGLAGVSRRSFYEQFANKQECFLATYDLIAARVVGRIRRGYRASGGAPEERLRTGFGQLAEGIGANWKGARLVIVEAQTVGPAGLARLRRTTATCEQMLSASFAGCSAQGRVAMPVVRGIVGGVHWILSRCLREGDAGQLPGLAEEMLGWALLFGPAGAETILAPTLAPAGNGGAALRAPAGTGARADTRTCAADDRSRLLHHVLRLALLECYESLSPLQIAEGANVSVDTFFELFAGKDECFLAALDTLRDELLAVAADPGLRRAEGWPRAVRRVMGELMRHLAERPLYAETIAAGAFAAGPRAAERDRRLMRDLATLLVAGAPAPARSAIAVDGIAGAISHTIRCQVADEEIERLPVLSDYISFIVLAPFIGADAAAAIVTEN